MLLKNHSFDLSKQDTHIFSVFVGHQDVHLGALGADDLTFQRVFAQVDMATVGLVDGDSRDLTHDLDMKRQFNFTQSSTNHKFIT